MENLVPIVNETELVSALHSDGVELPLPFEKDLFLMGVTVAGTSYVKNIGELYDALDEGDTVRLVREPDNPYDEYAIRIDAMDDEDIPEGASVKLGYIPRAYNKVVARLMDAGKPIYGVLRKKERQGSWFKIVVKVYMKD